MQEIIKVEQLTKSYDKLLAVDNVSFTVQKGMVFGLLGANGAGKSTTIEWHCPKHKNSGCYCKRFVFPYADIFGSNAAL